MAASFAQIFWEAAMTSFGSNILLFGAVVMVLAVLFVITKQSLSSSLLLGMVALDGMDRLSNDDNIFFLTLVAILVA